MKKYIIAILTAGALSGCADAQKQEKLLLDSVIAVHDKVLPAYWHKLTAERFFARSGPAIESVG